MAWLNPVPVGNDAWLFSRTGQVPLVVTAAHAGRRRIPGIEDPSGGTLRADPGIGGCSYRTFLTDSRTDVVLEAVFEAMDWGGVRPYAVMPEVSRRDCDLNRTWDHNRIGYENGGVGNGALSLAQAIYDSYYAELADFIAQIGNRFTGMPGAPVFVDIHGANLNGNTQIDLGTRNGVSASANVVYGDSRWTLSLHQAFQDEGFSVAPNPGSPENLGGCNTLRANGTSGVGADAIQLELDDSIRTQGEAARTGRRIATALQAFLRENGYPIIDEEPALGSDDEAYAVLFT